MTMMDNVTVNSQYRLRNFQPNNATLQDELTEMKNSIHFKALDDSFDFDTSLTDAQKNYIIKIFTENSEVNGSDVTEVAIIIYKKYSHEYIRYSGSVSDGWYKSSYSNSFDNWSAVYLKDTEIDQGG